MGKRKRKPDQPERGEEKELLEKQLLKAQIAESGTNTIFAIVSIAIAIVKAIMDYLK